MRYEVGDYVKIRDWDDMAEEFGCSSSGRLIRIPGFYFVSGMRDYCGGIYSIADCNLYEDDNGDEIGVYHIHSGNRYVDEWYFTDYMFEPGIPEEVEPCTEEELEQFILQIGG